jgi:DNA uptake protein ComE-like DNA-binding protein
MKFLTGFGLGIGLGILFAPDRGSRTRARIRQQMDEAGEQLSKHPVGTQIIDKASDAAERLRDAGQSAAQKLGVAPLVMLNTASPESLMKVPGIGPVLADRIIEGRPYATSRQVVERGILTERLLEEVERQSKAA